jgi:exopolyphosphatase/guanosine-5'-triphosphate,3'-diphosphate pyrophosphatase
MQKPIAAIDIGTNSVHLVVADIDAEGHMVRLDTDKSALRLGEEISDDGYISASGIQKTVETIRHMRDIARGYTDQIRAVATHATRSSRNAGDLLKAVQRQTGVKIEVIDGFEEARLAFLGMRYGLPLRDKLCLGLDIGGGSTELIIAKEDDIRYIVSLKIGAVTLNKHHFRKGRQATPSEIEDLREHIESHLSPLQDDVAKHKFDKAIASSGTAKALAMIHASLNNQKVDDPNGYVISGKDIMSLVERLYSLNSAKRIAEQFGIDAKRSEILVAGGSILAVVTQVFKINEWTISTYGLREGLVVDTFTRSIGGKLADLDEANVRFRSVLQFATRMNIDMSHARQVEKLALQIYRGLSQIGLSGLNRSEIDQDCVLLRCAALLHESGKFVSDAGYHKHSRYLILNCRLLGFTQEERVSIAGIARFHRKSIPTRTHEDCVDIPDVDRLRILSGILRMAVALDRTRHGRIVEVSVTRDRGVICFNIAPKANSTAVVELHNAQREIEALEKSFASKVDFRVIANGKN